MLLLSGRLFVQNKVLLFKLWMMFFLFLWNWLYFRFENFLIIAFNFVINFVIDRQFSKLILILTQLPSIGEFFQNSLFFKIIFKLLLHDDMQDSFFIIKHQISAFINKHLKDPVKLLLNCEHQRKSLADFNVNLNNTECTEFITLIR